MTPKKLLICALLLSFSTSALATEYFCNGQAKNSGTTRYYPNGQQVNSGTTHYYPNGQQVNSGSTRYYQNGQQMNSGSTRYYPNGQQVNSGSTRYYPNGQRINSGSTCYYETGATMGACPDSVYFYTWLYDTRLMMNIDLQGPEVFRGLYFDIQGASMTLQYMLNFAGGEIQNVTASCTVP